MPDWLSRLTDSEREQVKKTAMPRKLSPMLATLTDDAFSDPDWLYERKLDGERCLAYRDDDGVHLYSRKPQCLDDTYPELQDALTKCNGSFIVDGEIVAFEGELTSFSRLQQRMQIKDREEARASGIAVYLYLFDILFLDGYDLRQLPLTTRKKLLKQTLDFRDPIRLTPHRVEAGEAYLEEACRKGWEGLIAKEAQSAYQHSRSRKWLKLKCVNRQEMVIIGFTDPQGSRKHLGALELGYYEKGRLRYGGRVGTGFDEGTLADLHQKLQPMERQDSPVEKSEAPSSGGIHWVRPQYVAEIGFTEWTRDGKLRHPRYLGLRDDKEPKDVVREKAGGGQ